MLQINAKEEKYRFPTIDFKFKNAGAMLAVLTEFRVVVDAISVDLRPELTFRWAAPHAVSSVDPWHFYDRWSLSREPVGGTLTIMSHNDGWGAARACHVVVSGPPFDDLFDINERTYIGDVNSGEEKLVVQLTPRLTPSQFDHLWQRFGGPTDNERWHRQARDRKVLEERTLRSRESGRPSFVEKGEHRRWQARDKESERRIFLRLPRLEWQGFDETGAPFSGSQGWVGGDGHLFLSQSGFGYETYDPVCASMMPSDVTYCVILDPEKGAHQRVYPLSRTIEAGAAERFHIMIGAKKSCNVSLHFEFAIDNVSVERSLPFDIRIHNPRSSRWSDEYVDSDAVPRAERRPSRGRHHFAPELEPQDGPFLSTHERDIP